MGLETLFVAMAAIALPWVWEKISAKYPSSHKVKKRVDQVCDMIDKLPDTPEVTVMIKQTQKRLGATAKGLRTAARRESDRLA